MRCCYVDGGIHLNALHVAPDLRSGLGCMPLASVYLEPRFVGVLTGVGDRQDLIRVDRRLDFPSARVGFPKGLVLFQPSEDHRRRGQSVLFQPQRRERIALCDMLADPQAYLL